MHALFSTRAARRYSLGLRTAAAILFIGLNALLAACGGAGSSNSSGSAPLPPAATLTAIAIATVTPSVAAGATSVFTATGSYSDGSSKDLTNSAAWVSTPGTVATITPSSGIATGVAAGTANINASLSGITSNTVALTVTAAPVPPPTLTSIAVYTFRPNVTVGLTSSYIAIGTYSSGTTKNITSSVAWNSDLKNVATISASGVATPVAAGTTVITAGLNGITSPPSTLTVATASLVSIAVTPAIPTIAHGKTVQFTATGTYNDGVPRDVTSLVTWTSATLAVATIDGGGLSTAANLGTSTITATLTGGSLTAQAALTVTATTYAYATNFDDGTVSQYLIASDGSLSPLSTPTVTVGARPFAISPEITGQYVYVANYDGNSVSEFTIGTDGSLTPVGNGTVNTGSQPNGVTIDRSNKFAYVTNFGDNTVSQFTIGGNGELVAMMTPTLATGDNPASAVVDPLNQYLYVANFGTHAAVVPTSGGTISQYLLNVDGSLTPMANPTVDSGGGGPNSVVVDGTSHFAYAANAGSNTVSQFTIGTDGGLVTLGSPVATGLRPFGVTIDPSNRFVYVANSIDSAATSAGTLSQYKIQDDGSLVSLGADVPAGLGVSSVAVDPTGQYAYATNRGTSTLSQYSIDQTTGVLTPLSAPTVASGLHPSAIATGY